MVLSKKFNKVLTEKVGLVLTIIVLILLFSNLIPILATVAVGLTGLPLGSLFGPSGIVFILLMVGLIVTVLTLTFKKDGR